MGQDQSRVYMDHKNQQWVRTRRRTSRDQPRRTQSTRSPAPGRERRDDRRRDDRGRGRDHNSRRHASPEEDYYSEEDYRRPPPRDERLPPRREEREPPILTQGRERQGAPRPRETREHLAQAFDTRRQAEREPRPGQIEREEVFSSQPRGPPHHQRRHQAPMPAPLNVPRQGFRPEMNGTPFRDQVCGEIPRIPNAGLNTDFGNSMRGRAQAPPAPTRLGVGLGERGEENRAAGPSEVVVESCPNCGYSLRGCQTRPPGPNVMTVQELGTGAENTSGLNRMENQPSSATPMPSRIPVMNSNVNQRESQRPFPSAALPRAMQSTNMGNLPAHLQPTSSRTPQRPDSPYPSGATPKSAVRAAHQQRSIQQRSTSRSGMLDPMIRAEAWIDNGQPARRTRLERTVHFNSPVVQSFGASHPSRQPRGPTAELSRSARPVAAAPQIVKASSRGTRAPHVQIEDPIDFDLPEPQPRPRGPSAAAPTVVAEAPSQSTPFRRSSITSDSLPHHPEPAHSLKSFQIREAAAWGNQAK